jgi:hypothetical protein
MSFPDERPARRYERLARLSEGFLALGAATSRRACASCPRVDIVEIPHLVAAATLDRSDDTLGYPVMSQVTHVLSYRTDAVWCH